jgi:large subunit ribosomal protein L9
MATKLLLLSDVEDLGRSGDIVSVKPGYARNFLLPQEKAVVADKNALRLQARLQEERNKKALHDRQESEVIAKSFEGLTLAKIVKVDHDGHMYGSVSITDILHLLQQHAGVALEKRSVLLKHPIKELGVHTIGVKLKEGVSGSFMLKVMAEQVNGVAAPEHTAEEQQA